MISQGTQLGIFEESEREMVTHIFRLSDRRISTVMTPRTDVTFINAEAGRDEWIQLVIESGYSRFPVFIDTLDNVIGMVHVKDLLHQSMKGWPFDLQSALQAPIFVPETATILEVLEQIKQNGIEMALVIDEFGGLMGLVSLNDILEAIVGDVELPLAGEDPDVVRREDGSYLIEGMLKLDELKDVLDVETLPDEEKGYYETLGGFLMTQLGRIPATGDSYDWQGYHFEVVDMDGRRVDKVLVVPLK
jgi:putative hemolysin